MSSGSICDAAEAFAGRGGVSSDSMGSISRAPGRVARDVDAAEAFVDSGFPLADDKNRGGRNMACECYNGGEM